MLRYQILVHRADILTAAACVEGQVLLAKAGGIKPLRHRLPPYLTGAGANYSHRWPLVAYVMFNYARLMQMPGIEVTPDYIMSNRRFVVPGFDTVMADILFLSVFINFS